jgi:phage tail protein X
VSGGAAQPSSSPPAGPGAGFDVTATENTQAVALRVGQTLAVVLHARPGMANWSRVQSSDQSVLLPIVNPAASAARGVTLAAFKAIAPGKARIDAMAAPDCSPGLACPAYLMVLTIDVTVTLG